jgi:diguanylate cyclase (GGDEF)-like protein
MSGQEDDRNVAPSTSAAGFWSYLGAVSLAGLVLFVMQAMQLSTADFTISRGALITISVLVVIGEVRPLVIAGMDVNGVSTSSAFIFAMLLHQGLPMALLLQAVAILVADMTYRRAPWRTCFNVAQFSLSFGAAQLVLEVLGRHASGTHPLSVDGHDLPAVGASVLAYFIVNMALVSGALALKSRTSFQHELRADLTFQALATSALLGLAPIIVVVMEQGPALIPLLLFPLGAVYATAGLTVAREQRSLQDPLTGLPNRRRLVDATREAIEAANESDTHVALFLLDLDRFKEINDTLGHVVGDELLQWVGTRLTGVVGSDDVVGRLGGDEFAVLVTGLDDPKSALDFAEKVGAALAEPFRHQGLSHEIDASLGIAVYPQHGSDFDTLLQRADVAMYVAKDNGTRVQVYSAEIDRHSTTRLGMVGELRSALDNGELLLHYQPKADLRTGDVVGVEALLRWNHPTRGIVAPDDFLSLAEQTGLMRNITQFVLDEALSQLSEWWHHGLMIQAAVNVSARDLYDRNFAEILKCSIERYDVPPRALMIEVTESVLMTDPARAASTLLSLAAIGVGVSLDDFGTGYSSLVHLKRLPVSEVKIDRSFVIRMDVNDDDAAIVRSIIDLASALGLRTVAEGVETRDSWERLAVYGCDAAQGWYLAKAMPGDVATEWLEDAQRKRPGRRSAQGRTQGRAQTPAESPAKSRAKSPAKSAATG